MFFKHFNKIQRAYSHIRIPPTAIIFNISTNFREHANTSQSLQLILFSNISTIFTEQAHTSESLEWVIFWNMSTTFTEHTHKSELPKACAHMQNRSDGYSSQSFQGTLQSPLTSQFATMNVIIKHVDKLHIPSSQTMESIFKHSDKLHRACIHIKIIHMDFILNHVHVFNKACSNVKIASMEIILKHVVNLHIVC